MYKKNESVKKLEIGKDYVHLMDSNLIVIDRSGNANNNGFNDMRFHKTLNCTTEPYWREVTEEEVVEAFRRHLVYRYGEDWETMKIKEMHPSATSDLDINDGAWCIKISKHSNGWDVWNNNGLLYRNGIWVERLEEEEPKIHIKEAIKENTVIHCETEEEAKRVLGMAHTLGYKWWSGKNYENNTEWGDCESTTCYYLFEGGYSDYDYFKKNYYTIIPSTQIADLNDSEMSYSADKKRYEVIKTTFSDFKQLSLGDNKTNKIIAHFVEQDEETALLAKKISDILNLMEK